MTTRRKFLQVAGRTLGTAMLARPALAQSKTVKLGLPWLPTGQYTYPYVAREIGAWSKRGLDVQVLRGAGTLAALQGLVGGQTDIAILGTPAVLNGVLRGVPLAVLGTIGYEHTLALALPADGPVKAPKDLVGRKVGQVPAAGDTPLFPIFLRKHGVDPAKVQTVALEAKLLEQTLISGQVDAVPIYATSSLPVFVVKKFPLRLLPYSAVGLKFNLTQIVAKRDFVAANRQLVQDTIEGLNEGIKFTLIEPEKSIDLHLKANPELSLIEASREYLEVGQDVTQVSIYSELSRQKGLGYTDFADLAEQVGIVRQTTAKDVTGSSPPVESYTTNEFVGHVMLTPAEWDAVRKRVGPAADLVGLKV